MVTDLGSVSVLLGNGDGTFATKSDYAIGTGARYHYGIAVGDFNGDGKQDLVATNWGSNTVSVLLGNGNGTFQPKADYATGINPDVVAVGDFNGDGNKDLVMASYGDNGVSVMLGNGDGSFAAWGDYATGSRPYNVAVGDFNSDGKQDLVTASYGSDSVSVLLGNGDGSFATKSDYAVGPWDRGPIGVAVGDFNGDDKQDLATADLGSNSVSVLLGNGHGSFAASIAYATGTSPGDVKVADLNSDGMQDLIAANTQDSTVSVLLSTTLSPSPTPPTVSSPNGGENWLVDSAQTIIWTPGTGVGAAFDISRDGGSSWTYLGSGYANSGSCRWTVSGPTTTQAKIRVTTSAGADTSNAVFTIGPPAPPPTVTSPNGGENWPVGSVHTITWTPGTGTGATIAISRDGGSSWSDIVSGLDNSGSYSWTVSGPTTAQAKIRVTTSAGADTSNAAFTIGTPATLPTVISPNGGESWPVGSAHTITWTVGSGTLAAIAISRDGGSSWSDIVSGLDNSGSYSWTVSGPGTAQAKIRVTTSAGADISNAVFTIGTPGTPPTVSSPNGGESWPMSSAHTITWMAGTGTGATIAISRDGGSSWSDIVSDLANSGSYIWTVSGPATTQAKIRVTTFDGSDTSDAVFTIAATGFATHVDYATGMWPVGCAIGDFNGDGKRDLVVANWQSNTISVLLGNGNGTFQPKVDYAIVTGPENVAVGDFNADGKQDLAVVTDANTVSVLLGNGNGSFTATSDCATGSSPRAVAVGDFNGDGKQDLATANYDGNSVSVLLGNGDGTFQPKVDYATATGAVDVAIGDFNGDGKRDLVTANAASNTVSVLLGNGDGSFAAKSDYAIGSDYGYANGIAIGDFNGDGNKDLATANYGASSVSVLLGNGDGTFAAKSDYATGPWDCVRQRSPSATSTATASRIW